MGSRVRVRLSIVERSILVASFRVVKVSSDNVSPWAEPLGSDEFPSYWFCRSLLASLKPEEDGAALVKSSVT